VGFKAVLLGSENMLGLKQLTGVKLTWNIYAELKNTIESKNPMAIT